MQRHGGVVGQELADDRPIYDTPVKNMRATQAAISELEGLEGSARDAQQERIRVLIEAAHAQQAQSSRNLASSRSRTYKDAFQLTTDRQETN